MLPNKRCAVYYAIVVTGIGLCILTLVQNYLRGQQVSYGAIELVVIWGSIALACLGLTLILRIYADSSLSHLRRLLQMLNIVSIVLLCCLVGLATYAGGLYGQLQTQKSESHSFENQTLLLESPLKSMVTKKVIIRNDDIGSEVDVALLWLNDIAERLDFKVTHGVIPGHIKDHSDVCDYLSGLDKERFELATHGLYHEYFEGKSYDEQRSLIESATNIMIDKLNYQPYTFIPPHASGDTITSKAVKSLGYHSITDISLEASYCRNWQTDFLWEISYDPVEHRKFEEFKNNYDVFCDSSDEFYMLTLHHLTFIDETGNLDEELTSPFEQAIDYIKNKEMEFLTVEEAYQWSIDQPNLIWGEVDQGTYFIDLTSCQYDHMIQFEPQFSDVTTIVTNITTGESVETYSNVYDSNIRQFKGINGNCYEIEI